MNTSIDAEILAPPHSLLSRNPLQWLRYFGPGAIVASVNVGSGEVLFPSRSGALFGYAPLWIFLLVSLLKWAMAYSSMRHMVLSGAHPFERWSQLPGPRGWLPLFVVLIAVLCTPFWSSFMQGILGTVSTWIFGIGDLQIWATAAVGVSLLLLACGGYQFLERAQIVILGVTILGVFASVVSIGTDWLGVLKGLLIPQSLVYPDWARESYPNLQNRTVWVELSMYAAAIGGQSYDYLCYASFLRDKQWGRAHVGVAGQDVLKLTAVQPHHPARAWVRAAIIDTVLSFVMIVLIAGAFAILGAVVLRPQQLLPEGVDLLNHQALFLTRLSPLLLPLYQLAVFSAFFGSMYAGPEMTYRTVYEYLLTISRSRDRLPVARIRWIVIVWTFGGGLTILWLKRLYSDVTLVDIITPAGLYTGVLLCSFFCLANVWADRKFLPDPLRLPGWLGALNLLGGVVFAVIGVKALWDHSVWHIVVLPGLLCVAIMLARCLPFVCDEPAVPGNM